MVYESKYGLKPYEKTNTKDNLTRHLTWMIPNDLNI